MLRSLLLVPTSLVLALAACGGDDGQNGGGADCVEQEVSADFIETVRLSSFAEAGDFVNDPPVPADAVLTETSAGPDGDGHIATFTTEATQSQMVPVYQSTLGQCDNSGRISGGEVDTYQAVTGGLRVRADFQDGSVTISELPE